MARHAKGTETTVTADCSLCGSPQPMTVESLPSSSRWWSLRRDEGRLRQLRTCRTCGYSYAHA